MVPFALRSLCLSFALVAGLLVVTGCPPGGECQQYSDCPTSQFCQDGVCVDGTPLPDGGTFEPPPPPPPPDDGGPAPDGGEPTLDDVQVRTLEGVPWIQWHPTDPDLILFAELQEAGGTVASDRVRAIDTDALRVVTGAVYELTTMFEGACTADSIVFAPAPDETWFNCDLAPALRIVFDDAVAQPTNNASESAHVVHRVPGTTSDFPRVLAAERGGNLRALQIRDTDGLNQQRFSDTFQLSVSGVTQIFDVAAGTVPGTHVLVHNAVSGLLVPLSRDPGSEVWTATAGLPARTLPAETHIVWRTGNIAASGNATSPNQPNYMTVEPSTGLARYWSYEQGQEILPFTRFEANAQFLGAKPGAAERLLIALSPSSSFLFYARADGGKVYRIPLTPGGDDLVRQVLIDVPTRVISGVLAVSDDTVWVSYENENLVERVTLDRAL